MDGRRYRPLELQSAISPDVVALGDWGVQMPGDDEVEDALATSRIVNFLRIRSSRSTDRYQLTWTGWSLSRCRVEPLASACRTSVVLLEDGGVTEIDSRER